jgi:nitrite reductase/ring-hydroxylating ferredoxin subunit
VNPREIALLTRDQLPEGKIQYLLHPPDHLIVVRLGDEVFALDQRCSHAGASLLTGQILGRTVECRAHGCRFDLASGRLAENPAKDLAGDPSEDTPGQRCWRVERRGDGWAVLDETLNVLPAEGRETHADDLPAEERETHANDLPAEE